MLNSGYDFDLRRASLGLLGVRPPTPSPTLGGRKWRNASLRTRPSVPRRPASVRLSEYITPYEEDLFNQQLENKKGPSTWATGFEKLLEDAKGYETFSEFLKKEFSAENIHFWTSCEKYKKLDSVTERAKEAQCIYSRHLCKGALEPVNVDSQARNITPDALHKADTQLFVHAQKQIFNLMKFDSYPRFLKSDLYKECLADEEAEQCHKEQINDSAVKSKLKKSLSNAEDRRRKSLLPWHRKNRSKSKDRSEPEFIQPEIPQENEDQSEKDRYSSRSSLTSWDLTMSNSQDDTKSLGESSTGNCTINKNNLCRVILSDGATTVVQIRQNETVKQMVNRLLDKRGLSYSNYEVYISTESKAIDISKDSAFLAGCEVLIQTRVVFKLDLPNRKVVSVRSKPTKILSDVLRPILHKFGYKLELVHVLELPGKDKFVDISVPVTSVDGCRLLIQLNENAVSDASIPIATHNNSGQSLDELTNKVFEEVLQEKAHTNRRMRSDQGSMKSEDWGSEHSSGIFGRFLRRDSTNPDKRNKKSVPSARSKGSSAHGSVEDIGSDSSIKKPLIAKWKAGVKLHIAASKSESDELYEGLKRAQRQRLEDQRGTEINFELPDFLKDKENVQQNAKKVKKRSDNITSELTSRFYDIDTGNITPSKIKQHIQHFDRFGMPIESKSSNESSRVSLHLNSPTKSQLTKFSDDSPSKSSSCSNVSSRSSGMSLESTMIENTMFKHENKTESRSPSRNTPTILNGDNSEPPPLPPKPKVLPIKPSNWKKMPTVKQNDVRQKPAMYLDQPASSFV